MLTGGLVLVEVHEEIESSGKLKKTCIIMNNVLSIEDYGNTGCVIVGNDGVRINVSETYTQIMEQFPEPVS